jgi:sarcosine oxidase subunit alpha
LSRSWRLPSGGTIDRSHPLRFTFNGKPLEGYQGDTLASALLANGINIVGRSLKYHRPRSILTDGSEEPNAILQLGEGSSSETNVRATEVELFDGLVATSVNAWPSVDTDIASLLGPLSNFLAAGFYYKTFMRPRVFWNRLYEPIIRKMAGLGQASSEPDPDTYDHKHTHCDVLVVGAGPAGLAAAHLAATSGARVILADEKSAIGGSLLGQPEVIEGLKSDEWVTRVATNTSSCSEFTLLRSTTVVGVYDHNYVCAVEQLAPADRTLRRSRKRFWRIRAAHIILATGAMERPVVFKNNDTPGIMLAGAVRSYINRYAVTPGERAVIFTNNNSAYDTAFDLVENGVELTGLVDVRHDLPDALVEKAESAEIRLFKGHAVVRASGGKRLSSVLVSEVDRNSEHLMGSLKKLDCDTLAVSGGWNPVIHLHSQIGGRLRWDERQQCLVPDQQPSVQDTAGAINGTYNASQCAKEGRSAAKRAMSSLGRTTCTEVKIPSEKDPTADDIPPLWSVDDKRVNGLEAKTAFVDLQNDVKASDIALAVREGFHSVEHLKRYTATGMGTDQGRTSNVNALALLSRLIGKSIEDTGTTTFRPPYAPVTLGAIAGRNIKELADPVRITPIHDWHMANGAVFEDVGPWKRPYYYPRDGEDMTVAVRRECMALRNNVGIVDVSTLGKIDIRGPDAAEFLERIYTNNWHKLPVGGCRYGIMCHTDGMVFDDGVTTRLADDHFLMTTTTGNAGLVFDWLEEWLQTEWPHLKVYCTSVTDQWSTVAIGGPRSRDLMKALAPSISLDNESFPFMTSQYGQVAGIDARVARISFTGDLSFEVNVPANYGLALWEAIMETGAQFKVTPYGTEAMHVLRAEKGFVIVGQDTDSTITPFDLGMDWIVSKTKEDFVGQRSMARSDLTRPERRQLVGLTSEHSDFVIPESAQLIAVGAESSPRSIGFVTSSYFSPVLNRSIALALVENGKALIGNHVWATFSRTKYRAEVCSPIFYDPNNERRDG